MSIEETLRERHKTHGEFKYQAVISQHLKKTIHYYEGHKELDPDQLEALEMIAHKIARILNGNANEFDHWHDIAGYATLVAERLK